MATEERRERRPMTDEDQATCPECGCPTAMLYPSEFDTEDGNRWVAELKADPARLAQLLYRLGTREWPYELPGHRKLVCIEVSADHPIASVLDAWDRAKQENADLKHENETIINTVRTMLAGDFEVLADGTHAIRCSPALTSFLGRISR